MEIIIFKVHLVVHGKRLFIEIITWNQFGVVNFLGLSDGLSSLGFLINFIINVLNEIISTRHFMSDSSGVSFSEKHKHCEAYGIGFHSILIFNYNGL
jgi:hypothetical protein